MKRMRNSRTTNAIYLSVMKSVFSILSDQVVTTVSSLNDTIREDIASFNKGSLYVLKENGMITKTVNGYKWTAPEPNLEMARELVKRINKKHSTYPSTKRKKAEKARVETTPLHNVTLSVNGMTITVPKGTELSLSSDGVMKIGT